VFGDVPVSEMKPDWTPEAMPDYFQLKTGTFSRSVLSIFSAAARSATFESCRAELR
jgi:hypothetical protein